MPETTTDPKVTQELAIVTSAIEVSLGISELTTAFAARRDELTAVVYEFTKPPTNDEEQAEILTAQRAVAKLRTDLVKNAAALKSPLNSAKSRILELENAAVEFLKKAEAHAQGLVNNYQQALANARREEEQRVAAEQKRIADQAAQAQREQEEAERKRQQAEIAAKAAQEATTKAARDKAAAEAAKLTQEAETLDAAAYAKELDAAMAPAPVAVSAPAPQARTIIEFSLAGRNDFEKGESLEKFHRAHGEFFSRKIVEEGAREYTIKLKIKDLTDAINGVAPFQKLTAAPGLVLHERLSTLR